MIELRTRRPLAESIRKSLSLQAKLHSCLNSQACRRLSRSADTRSHSFANVLGLYFAGSYTSFHALLSASLASEFQKFLPARVGWPGFRIDSGGLSVSCDMEIISALP